MSWREEENFNKRIITLKKSHHSCTCRDIYIYKNMHIGTIHILRTHRGGGGSVRIGILRTGA